MDADQEPAIRAPAWFNVGTVKQQKSRLKYVQTVCNYLIINY